MIAVAVILSGCGFQLQGSFTVPHEMERTYIDAVDEYSLFGRELRGALQQAGVSIVDTPDAASAVFRITVDETDQRVLSVSGRNVPTEFEVYYTVEYTVIAGNTPLLRTQDLTITRDYTYDTTRVLGKAREEGIMRDAIVQDLVRVVLRQLSSL